MCRSIVVAAFFSGVDKVISTRRDLRKYLISALCVSICCLNLGCQQSKTDGENKETQRPLTSFRQILTSSTTKLSLHQGQEVTIPVRIENPGPETWPSTGQFPVTASYKWFDGTSMLPIEGERTTLPGSVAPDKAVNVDLRVVAPNQPGSLALRITLVQEAVAWFLTKSNTFLELPVTVK